MDARELLLIALAVFWFSGIGAMAASDPPRSSLLSACPEVLLVKVDRVQDKKMAFSIIEVWKGKSRGPLLLTPIVIELKPGDECVLCGSEQSSDKGTVSETALYGGSDWACLPVSINEGRATVEGVGSLDKAKATCLAKK